MQAVRRIAPTGEREDHVGAAVLAAEWRDDGLERGRTLDLDRLPRSAVVADAVLVEIDVRIRLGQDAPGAAAQPIGARAAIDDLHVVAVRRCRERRLVALRCERERAALQITQRDRERVTGAHLLELDVAERRAETLVLEHALQDEALRRERERLAVRAGELEQRAGVGREQHDVEVVEHHRDRCRAFDLGECLARRRDEIAAGVELGAEQRREHFAVELALAVRARITLDERAIVDDDPVVERDRAVRDHRLVVVDVRLRAVRRESRVAGDRDRRDCAVSVPSSSAWSLGLARKSVTEPPCFSTSICSPSCSAMPTASRPRVSEFRSSDERDVAREIAPCRSLEQYTEDSAHARSRGPYLGRRIGYSLAPWSLWRWLRESRRS